MQWLSYQSKSIQELKGKKFDEETQSSIATITGSRAAESRKVSTLRMHTNRMTAVMASAGHQPMKSLHFDTT